MLGGIALRRTLETHESINFGKKIEARALQNAFILDVCISTSPQEVKELNSTTLNLDDDDISDGSSINDEKEIDVDHPANVDVDIDEVPKQKSHFLGDAVPPPELIADLARILTFGDKPDMKSNIAINGEQLKMDKIYERDGGINDYELAASGYTKKELTQIITH